MPAEQAESMGTAITGYRIILPDDWAQIPLRHGTEEAIRHILDEAFGVIPADAPADSVGPFKRELERRFRAAVAQAQESDALDLYIPVKSTSGVNLGASIVVSESLLPNLGTAADAHGAPTDIAVQLLAQDGVEDADLSSGQLDGALAVRREHVVSAHPDQGVELGSRRVEYIVSVPDDPDRWFVAAFSTVGSGDPRDDLADALVEWFDAVMATLRWSHG
ncbi:hypothetical protein [Streptomyces sp. NPDC003635]